MTMESLLNAFIVEHPLEEILAGAPIDLQEVSEQNRKGVIAILLHCCINGPYSPHKVTNYPVIGETSLDDLVGRRVSNNGLKKTCEIVATWLESINFDQGYMITFGHYWPKNGYIANTEP